MPAELNEILAEWRTASGPYIVQASELRRVAAELDRLRKVAETHEAALRTAILTELPVQATLADGSTLERGRLRPTFSDLDMRDEFDEVLDDGR